MYKDIIMDFLSPNALKFELLENGDLRATVHDTTYERAYAVPLFPLSLAGEYIALMHHDGGPCEIGVIRNLSELKSRHRAAIEQDLRLRYFVPAIIDIKRIRSSKRKETWEVETDRGPATFTVRNRRENILFTNSGAITITDENGRRFRLSALSALPEHAQSELAKVI